MNMSDHWKALTRMLGATDAAEPPKKTTPAKAPEAAQRPVETPPAASPEDSASTHDLVPPEPMETRSSDDRAQLLDDLVQVPERETLPGFGDTTTEGSSWDDLVQDLGVAPIDNPQPKAADRSSAVKPAVPSKPSSRKPTKAKSRSGFGSGLVETIESEDTEAFDVRNVDAAVEELERVPEAELSPPPRPVSQPAESEASSHVGSKNDSDEPSIDDDDLFAGFKGRQPRRGRRDESAGRESSVRAESVSREREPVTRDRSERVERTERDSATRPAREESRDRDRGESRREPRESSRGRVRDEENRPANRSPRGLDRVEDGEDDFGGEALSPERERSTEETARGDSDRPRSARRGRRRGQRQRMGEDWESGNEPAAPRSEARDTRSPDEDRKSRGPVETRETRSSARAERAPLDDDDTGVRHAMDRIEETDEDGEVPRRRRRRRRGRGRGGKSESTGEATAVEANSDDDSEDSPTARTSRDGERSRPVIDAVFDDDHEDAEEAAELLRGRRRRPRRGSGDGENRDRAASASPSRSSRDDDSAGGEVDYLVDESLREQRKQRNVVTWLETVDILISSNMSGRKSGGGNGGGDSRGRGRQSRSNGSRRRD